jgi:DNA (cytosine-5)-methyltransferase 1
VDDYETWIEGGVMPTLNAFDNGDVRTTVIVFHPHYHDGARVQGDTMNTLTSRMGTGGNNVSGVATIFSHTQGLDAQPSETVSPTLRAGGSGMAVAFSPSDFANYSEGIGTLKAVMTNNNSPVIEFDAYNHTTSEKNQTLRTGSDLDKMGTVFVSSNVRRLTPVECERLQGFPDDWTSVCADSIRYRQVGNAVAVPVVEWLIQNIVDVANVS